MKTSLKNRYFISGLVLAALLAAVWGVYAEFFGHPVAIPPPKTPGQPAPLFSGKTVDGQNYHFSPNLAERNLVVFWASWCGPCAQETPALIALSKRNANWKITAVSNDSVKSELLDFLKIFPGLRSNNISLVWDRDQEIAAQFALEGLPESFLIDRQGRLIQKFVGTVNWDKY